MAGKKESGTQWRHISVVIRADILEQAVRQKIDISGACNQALAELTGIDYRQQKIPEGIITEPLIVASNGIPDLHSALPLHLQCQSTERKQKLLPDRCDR